MPDDDDNERPMPPNEGAHEDPDERAFFNEVLAAGRKDAAPPDLAHRLADNVVYRNKLARDAKPHRPRRALLAATLSFPIGIAAGFLLAPRLPNPQPSITPEQGSTPSSTPSSTSGPKQPAPDLCVAGLRASGQTPLIDDFEDGDDAIAPVERRHGFWRWVREIDAPGTAPALIPIPRSGPTPQNKLAVHVKGDVLVDWGAVIEFTFRPACYDASAYAGIAFEARGPGRIYVAPREVRMIPVAEGGTCEDDCHNPHVVKVDLDDSFKRYEVRWEQMRQRGKGKPVLDASRLNSLAFMIRPEDTPYDVWVDEVRFVGR